MKHGLVGSDDLFSKLDGQRDPVRVDQDEVSARFALGVVYTPNPSALVSQEFKLMIKREILEGRTTPAREFGRLVCRDKNTPLHQFRDDLRSSESNNLSPPPLLLLFYGCFFET